MKTTTLFLLLILVLSGCSLFDLLSPGANRTENKEVVTIEAGETATLSAFDASLTFVEKSEDSRCPIDVDCVWAGRATVELSLIVAQQPPAAFSLTLGTAPEQPRDEDGYPVIDTLGLRITLLDLRPYPDTRIPEPEPSIIDVRVEQP
jgi:hypothetical protein